MKPILAWYGIQDRYTHQFPAYTHDHNLCLMQDGKIEKYFHLERFTRRKNNNGMSEIIEQLIDSELNLDQDFQVVSVNSFVGNSFISKTGKLRVEPNAPISLTDISPGNNWFQSSPWEGFAPTGGIISHELAHVFSCLPFFGNFKENSLLVHFDGGASQGNFSAYHFENQKLQLLENQWELSHLSKLFNDNALSFALMKAQPGEHCSVPGKLMGYAAMGNTNDDLEKWLIENDYFKDIWEDDKSFTKAGKILGWNGTLSNNKDSFLMNVAAGLQSIFQKGIVSKLKKLKEQTKANYLYYTGGCALNITTNSEIINSSLFQDVFIPPACNDSGLSLGAAAFLNWKNKNAIQTHRPYLNFQQKNESCSFSNSTIKLVAEKIMDGKIIGVCNGLGEVGPRALGNRSIIARADVPAIANRLSMKCKGREWFRPVAPIMLERNSKQVTGLKDIHHLSRFMLLEFKILPAYQKVIAGTVHQNNTARIQTLFNRTDNPFCYDLLDYLDEKYQLMGLINTSFNQRGEPIVQTKADTLTSAKKMKLDGVILHGKYQDL